MIPIRDNTNTIYTVGAFILANMYLLHNEIYGFFLWMGFACLFVIVDILEINAELKMIDRRIRYLNHIHQINKKPKRKEKK